MVDVWNDLVIDGYEVSAKYIPPQETLPELRFPSHSWYTEHVKKSKYFLQIVKCNDRSCNTPLRNFIDKMLPDRFMPPLYPLQHSYKKSQENVDLGDTFIPDLMDGIKLNFATLTLRSSFDMKPTPHPKYNFMPYGYYYPSAQKQLGRKICKICQIYFATIKSLTTHKKIAHLKKKKNLVDDESTDLESEEDFENTTIQPADYLNDAIPVIRDMDAWLRNPWTE